MLLGREFHQVGARAEKAPVLVEDAQTPLGLGTTRRLFSTQCKPLRKYVPVEEVLKVPLR